MDYLSNDHKNHPNQYKNSHKQCEEMGHHIVNMMETQLKLRQQHGQSFPMEGTPSVLTKVRNEFKQPKTI